MSIYDPLHDCKLIGASRAICGIKDSAVIVHARPGCHSGVLLLRMLSSKHDDAKIVCSGLRGKEMAFGGEGRVATAIKATWEYLKPPLIAVLNCSAPAIMGDDIEGVSASVKREVPAKILTLSTAGYEGPDWIGYEEALNELVRFMKPSSGSDGTVNLIGFKDDEPRALSDLFEMERMLNAQGVKINAVLTCCSFEELKKAPEASLNVVLGGDGLRCAQTMKEKFGIPYVSTPYPFGLDNTKKFLAEICENLGRKINHEFIHEEQKRVKEGIEKIYFHLQGIYDLPVAIIGESSRAFDLANFLNDELGFNVKILAVTSRNYLTPEREEGVYSNKLLVEPDKFEMDRKIKSSGIEIIFGSTMERELAYELDVPLVRFSFPVIDAVSISDSPYAGFKGVLSLVENVVNSIIARYEKVEV
jgi:nitrogenase molybdenum-iron protein beta chain